MTEDIKFSVLIPVYNVEKYLHHCIESVLNQNYRNVEIILVDDGSTDSSGRICDEYAKEDQRITVIHKENSGLLSARRTAIKIATGDYFLFLDSDDYWDIGLLEKVASTIKKHCCDMVIFRCKNVYKDKEIDSKKLFEDESVFLKDEKIELYRLFFEGNDLNNLVTKVVKKSIVDKENDYVNMRDVSNGEDALQSVPLLLKAEKIVYISDAMYYYRRNTGMTKTIKPYLIYSITKVRAAIIKTFGDLRIDLSESISFCLGNYMSDLPKYILYAYIENPKELRKTLEYVFETDFYKMARKTAYNKQSLLNRIIICLTEKNNYVLIALCSKLLKLRNMLRG